MDFGHTSPYPLVCQRAGAALGDGQQVSKRAATVWNHSWRGQVLAEQEPDAVRAGRGECRAPKCQVA